MRLIAIAMIRNDADILPDFLGHCAALFDELLVVDHASTDGTAEMLAAAARHMALRVWRLAQQAKVQSLVTMALAREAVAHGADWVFPLDADEFPALSSREALVARLDPAAAAQAWTWRNLWPGPAPHFAACRVEGRFESLPAAVSKVAVARRLVEHPGFAIGHGNHGARPILPPAAAAGLGDLLHVPVRAPGRLLLKMATNQASNALRPDRHPKAGVQYRHAPEKIDRMLREDGAGLRRRFALGYPHVAGPEALARVEWVDVAPVARLAGLPAPVPDAAAVLACDATLDWQPLPDGPPATWRLRLEGDRAWVAGAQTA